MVVSGVRTHGADFLGCVTELDLHVADSRMSMAVNAQ